MKRWIDAMRCKGPRPAAQRQSPGDGGASVLGFGFTRDNRRQLTREQAGTVDGRCGWPGAGLGAGLSAREHHARAAGGGRQHAATCRSATRRGCSRSTSAATRPCFRLGLCQRRAAAHRRGLWRAALGRARCSPSPTWPPWVHLVDARTGKLLWKKPVGRWDLSNTTGTPLIVRQSRLRADLGFGDQLRWRGQPRVLQDARHVPGAGCAQRARWCGRTRRCPMRSPCVIAATARCCGVPPARRSGRSPAMDPRRGLIYVGTGEATSAPAWETTDSILALDMSSGQAALEIPGHARRHLPDHLHAPARRD